MSALELVREWPVDHVAAAVVGPAGVLETIGDLSHPFTLASVTKPLSAFGALVALEEKTVRLQDPVGPPESTLRHLLSHASGLGPEDGSPISPVARHRIYSNVGFDLFGAFIGERAGMAFSRFVEEGVFQPLGMANTSLGDSPARSAIGSVEDLARFVGELLSPTLVDQSTIDAATSVVFPGLSGVVPGFGRFEHCDWGLGFEIKADKRPHWTGEANSPSTFGHFGQSGTFFWVDPQVRLGLAVLTDRKFATWAKQTWPLLADAVLEEFTNDFASQ